MLIVNPEAHYLDSTAVNPYKFIERIGRTCYKSTDLITEGSAEKFVGNLCKSKHYAMLEHYWVHLKCAYTGFNLENGFLNINIQDHSYGGSLDILRYMQVTYGIDYTYISAPLRAFIELDSKIGERMPTVVKVIMNALSSTFPGVIPKRKYSDVVLSELRRVEVFCNQDNFIRDISTQLKGVKIEHVNREIMKHRTHTVLFICDRGVSHEFVRHRPCSFAQESTRYCNYSKDKFGNQITVVKPFFFNRFPDTAKNVLYDDSTYSDWLMACEYAEKMYFKLLDKGATPQEARSVLPNSLKTELVITANEIEWEHIIDLRYRGTTGSPHPQIKEVMEMIFPTLVSKSNGRLLKAGESNE